MRITLIALALLAIFTTAATACVPHWHNGHCWCGPCRHGR